MRSLNRSFGTLAALAFLGSTATAQVGIEHQKLTASDAVAGDEFGIAQALEGDTLVVAADQENAAAGAVYVFKRQSDGSWAETQKLTASDGEAGAEFGYAVAVSGDWIAVGARLDDIKGAVYMFQDQGSGFVEIEKFRNSDQKNGDHFGAAIEMQGTRMVVAAPRNDDDGADSGAAYFFEESGGTWSEVDKVTASNAEAGDLFPHTIALDGDRVIFSTIYDNGFAGAAYVFEHQGGGTWLETKFLTPSDTEPGDEFGFAMTLEGDNLLVSSRLDQEAGLNSGSMYAFEWDGLDWIEKDKFRGTDTDFADQFGFSVDMDGTRAVIGAIRAKTSGFENAGKTYLFERQSDGTYVQVAQMFVRDPDTDDFQGWAADIEGHTIAVSAVSDDEAGVNAGATYVAESDFLRSTDTVSVATGGDVDFYINLGVDWAGEEYWVLGSVTGTDPGLTFFGVDIPLNYDLYLTLTLFRPTTLPFTGNKGTLDSNGSGTFTITIPGGLDPALVGLVLYHAPTTYTTSPTRFTSAGAASTLEFIN